MRTTDQIIGDYLEAIERGESIDREELLAAHPEIADELREFFRSHDEMLGIMSDSDFKKKSIEAKESASQITTHRGVDFTNLDKTESSDPNDSGTKRRVGSYEILEEIDRGGMGVVFRARDTELNRIVALKMIRSGRLASENDIQRFRAEAQSAGRLSHPGIVSVYEVGTHQDQPYFSMAFVDGENLDRIHRKNPVSIDTACSLIREVALAIHHAHENGLVHRDLKPANIIVDQSGRPMIMDFGLAKSLEQDDGITGTGEIVGTINYMAPEQAAAKHDQVDRRTDVYSLGAILYYLCTGRAPFETDNPVDTLLRILDSEPEPANKVNPKVPREVAIICMRCLEKENSSRYASALEFANEIDRFLKGEPIEASRDGVQVRFRRWSRREPSLAGHLIGLGLIELTRFASYLIEVIFFGAAIGDYLRFTYIIAAWVIACYVLQKIQNRFQRDDAVKYAWAAADIAFLTLILWIADDNIGPLYVTYPLVVVVSGFFSQVRLVVFTTVVCLISFLLVFVNSAEFTKNTHYGVVGFAAIVAIGYVMCHLVHRIRLLNRLFDSSN